MIAIPTVETARLRLRPWRLEAETTLHAMPRLFYRHIHPANRTKVA